MENLSFKRRIQIKYRINKNKLMEFIRHDSKIASIVMSIYYLIKFIIIRFWHGEYNGLIVAGDAFRHTQFHWIRYLTTKILKASILKHGSQKIGIELLNIIIKNVDEKILIDLRKSIIRNVSRPFYKRLLILSPPKGELKGVLAIKFTEYFKYFLKVFDMKKISKDYILIVEPSSSGYFDEDILSLLSVDTPIIIQSPEPIDHEFIKSISGNMYPVYVGASCWVDHRIFFPKSSIKKEYDLIMVSNWADVKRHYHLFESLSKTKNKNLKIVLVGKSWPKTIDDIKNEASYYKVYDNITFLENMEQSELNEILNKSMSYLLLSKKEGVNKSIIEAMYSNIPVFLLKGFNYGYKYAYINSNTGGYIKKNGLVQFLNQHGHIMNNRYSPREWVYNHMTPEISIKIILDTIFSIEIDRGIYVNKDLAVKINNPDLDYYDNGKWIEYKSYYEKLFQYLM